jgi:hypothetical protein
VWVIRIHPSIYNTQCFNTAEVRKKKRKYAPSSPPTPRPQLATLSNQEWEWRSKVTRQSCLPEKRKRRRKRKLHLPSRSSPFFQLRLPPGPSFTVTPPTTLLRNQRTTYNNQLILLILPLPQMSRGNGYGSFAYIYNFKLTPKK